MFRMRFTVRWLLAYTLSSIVLLASGSFAQDQASIIGFTDRPGNDLIGFPLEPGSNVHTCRGYCEWEPLCKAFTYVGPGVQGSRDLCYLKNPIPPAQISGCCASGVKMVEEDNVDRGGSDYRSREGVSLDACQRDCAFDPACRAYTFVRDNGSLDQGSCHLKNARPRAQADATCCVSGYKPEHVGLVETALLPSGGIQPPSGAEEDNIGRIESPLSARQNTIWTTSTIPVCWENIDAAPAAERHWVEDQVAQTWERYSQIDFVGWGACRGDSRGIRIRIKDERPKVETLGMGLDGLKNGMILNFTCGEQCIRNTAVHEFGHALGFSHEQNRPDAPAWCHDQKQGTTGDVYMTPYDPDSVMNYCNDVGNNNGQLSAYDIAGLQFWYGPNLSSGEPWTPDCRQDAILFEHPRYGGHKFRVYGSLDDLRVDGFNDKVSSLCVPAGFRLILYAHPSFQGERIQFDGPSRVLSLKEVEGGGRSGWNDVVSSAKLINLRTGEEIYNAPTACRFAPTGFEHPHFGGKSIPLNNSIDDLKPKPFELNDKISSLCIPVGWELSLWEHANHTGDHLTLTGPMFLQHMPNGWNDKVTSVQLRRLF